MNTRRVNAAAKVILAAQGTTQTSTGIAFALESAHLLQSPRVAAELADLQARREALLSLLPTEPRPEQGLPNDLAASDAAYGVWEQVAEILGVGLPYDPAEAPADALTALFVPTHALREEEAAGTDRVVAYRDPHSPSVLLCRKHGESWQGVVPVTAEDLPDGGVCTFGRLSSLECGRDVLTDLPATGGAR